MEKSLINRISKSEILITGMLLSFIGGFLDAYTYILRGGVFANTQTGNIILLSFNIAKFNINNILYYITPIISFILGVLLSEFIKRKFINIKLLYWTQIIVLLETIILFLIGIFGNKISDFLVNTLISFVCSLQVSSFRKINGLVYATTMCTGNLRSLCDKIYIFLFDKKKEAFKHSLIYISIILMFIIGVIIGSLAANILYHKSIFICCIILLIILFILYEENKKD